MRSLKTRSSNRIARPVTLWSKRGMLGQDSRSRWVRQPGGLAGIAAAQPIAFGANGLGDAGDVAGGGADTASTSSAG